METIKLTVAQALIKFLDAQYIEQDGVENKFVEGISVIFGHGMVLGIGEALLHNEHTLKIFQGKNEQGQAHMAIGFAKQNNRKKIIAVASSIGPGSTNMVTAAATATANNIPLLLLPSDTFANRQPDPVLQQIEHPEDLTITANDSFKAVSKYFDRIIRPEQLMSALLNAMRVLTDASDCGAVTLALSQDVQGETFDYPSSFFEKRVHLLRRQPADLESLQTAIKMIIESKKPLIICGGGCKYSRAAEELKLFSEEFMIPFAETQAGKSTLESEFNYNLGGIGVTGNLAANTYAQGSDLIIGIGTRMTDFTTCSKWLFPNAKIVQINISVYNSLKLDACQIVGDAKTVLHQLTEILKPIGYKNPSVSEINLVKDAWNNEYHRLTVSRDEIDIYSEISHSYDRQILEFKKVTSSKLSQTRVIGILNDTIAEDSIVVCASGSLPGDLQRMWKASIRDTYHAEYGYSCMGYEIAAALGAKLARPAQDVYSFVGDASFMMLHSELVTSLQEKVKLHICLFDNMSNGCISNLQMSNGLDSLCTDFRYRNDDSGNLDGDFIQIDYAKIAEGYGCKSYRIINENELKFALEDSKNYQCTVLFDIKVLPKSMTNGYKSWWNVGLASVSPFEKVNKNFDQLTLAREKARKY